jgi:cytidylate kinase
MTREMGSQGKNIAMGLAERMGMQIVHHNLVEHDVSDALGCEESDVHRFLEGRMRVLDRWQLHGKKILNYTACEVFELAQQGNIIIRGWGSSQLLRPVAHVLCIRVCAPMEHRIQTLMARVGISDPEAARHEIEENDAAHERVLGRLSRSGWQDATQYDLVINTANVPIAEGVDMVVRLAGLATFQESAQSIAKLHQLKVESQVRNALACESSIKGDAAAINFAVDAQTGIVVLSGGVLRRNTRDQIAQIIRNLPDVTSVENSIRFVHSS